MSQLLSPLEISNGSTWNLSSLGPKPPSVTSQNGTGLWERNATFCERFLVARHTSSNAADSGGFYVHGKACAGKASLSSHVGPGFTLRPQSERLKNTRQREHTLKCEFSVNGGKKRALLKGWCEPAWSQSGVTV